MQTNGLKSIELHWSDYQWPLFFMLSMSCMGLMFPIAYILVPIILINSFYHNRYDFIIMLLLFFGGYGLTGEGVLPIKFEDLALLTSLILVFIYHKSRFIKLVLFLLALYLAVLLVIATFSTEPIRIQLLVWRRYTFFIYFIIPIAAFSGQKFDINILFFKLFPYAIIMCAFYIIDGFLFKGFILLPHTPFLGGSANSTFFSPVLYPFAVPFIRKYPTGLIILSLVIYPIAKCYKLRLWHWALIIGALAACQTFTVLFAFIVGYMILKVSAHNIIKICVSCIALFVVLYWVDSLLPERKTDYFVESRLRIKSSIDQIVNLSKSVDDVDLSFFGSGRGAQIIPKLELVSSMDKELTGLGFLHPDLTTNPELMIDNEYYIDIDKSEELAATIECEPFQVYINVGIIGVVTYIIFYLCLIFIIRKLRDWLYFVNVLVVIFICSLGAYGGLIEPRGLMLVAMAFASVLLENRSKNILQ